ncbi:NACHT, LRR and PYD domains-containing protein 1 homolog [Salmo salar]|uniref:NACHT, LRR and PYD domains-containing protein 1 homolog n=1 Tax=Salmo salar TaxID=8030 RepID=A0ABM3EB56_SALSA|nr:NACHT, LRR and PYD domains-containing protein 1 homolog [Salmo salar]
MKILHVEEHGVSLEEVHEVTRFHAKILHPKFSAFSVILRLLSWKVDVHCELMLYLTVMKESLIPRLYLFPSNPGQIQAVEQQESKFQGTKRIPITRPEQSFKLNSSFRLNIPCSTAINPPRIHLIHRDTTPSFFRAVVKMTGIDIEMELFSDDERTVWKEIVLRDEYYQNQGCPAESSLTGSPEQQLRSVRTEFVKRVSRPVLNELLDGLLQQTVINQEEMESVKVIAERAEKARDIIDMVLRKGNESCSRMINLLGELDPCLCSLLQTNSCSQPLGVGRPGRIDRQDGSTCSCCLLL